MALDSVRRLDGLDGLDASKCFALAAFLDLAASITFFPFSPGFWSLVTCSNNFTLSCSSVPCHLVSRLDLSFLLHSFLIRLLFSFLLSSLLALFASFATLSPHESSSPPSSFTSSSPLPSLSFYTLISKSACFLISHFSIWFRYMTIKAQNVEQQHIS